MLGLWREENQWTQRKVSVEERFDQVDFLTLNDDVNQCLLWLVITHDLLELTDTCTWMRSWKTCFLCIVQHGTRFRKCLWDFFRLSKWKPPKKLSRSLFFSDHCIKQKDSILLWVCSVIDHRWHQNVVKTSVTHSPVARVSLLCFYHILTSSVIYYWTDAWQHGIYLLNRMEQ